MMEQSVSQPCGEKRLPELRFKKERKCVSFLIGTTGERRRQCKSILHTDILKGKQLLMHFQYSSYEFPAVYK